MTTLQCEHLPATSADPQADQCQECGSRHSLRLCTTCGHVGCCESQQSHGRKHALEAKHPVILSLPLSGRSFTWCYEHNDYVQTPAGLAESRPQ